MPTFKKGKGVAIFPTPSRKRKGLYKPSLLGLEYKKVYGLTRPKAPRMTAAIGIRLAVGGKKRVKKKKRRKR